MYGNREAIHRTAERIVNVTAPVHGACGESSWRCRLPSRQTGEPEGLSSLASRTAEARSVAECFNLKGFQPFSL
ncbi:hypothetical protein F7734_49500 [Scytonema sp. UIC 10036]|nr:hypothetical protein [Scytonema sp. UIC 10036]